MISSVFFCRKWSATLVKNKKYNLYPVEKGERLEICGEHTMVLRGPDAVVSVWNFLTVHPSLPVQVAQCLFVRVRVFVGSTVVSVWLFVLRCFSCGCSCLM